MVQRILCKCGEEVAINKDHQITGYFCCDKCFTDWQQSQIAALTEERDKLKGKLELSYAASDAKSGMTAQLIKEKDALRAELATVTSDRDGWAREYERVCDEHSELSELYGNLKAGLAEARTRYDAARLREEQTAKLVEAEYNRLKAELEKAKLKWETEKPPRDGWYFIKWTPNSMPHPELIRTDFWEPEQHSPNYCAAFINCQWKGPLEY